jgi:hypothetical protein
MSQSITTTKQTTNFLKKIEFPPEASLACWEWTGAKTTTNYGHFRLNGRTTKSYRVSYATFVGKIPDGLTIDHLCRNRVCVNPMHLEAVSHQENMRRIPGITSQYPGVHWCKKREKWASSKKCNGKKYNLGYYDIELEAYEAFLAFDINTWTPPPSTSKYRGVHWNKKDERWVAQKYTNGKTHHIGSFHSEEEAYQAYLSFQV